MLGSSSSTLKMKPRCCIISVWSKEVRSKAQLVDCISSFTATDNFMFAAYHVFILSKNSCNDFTDILVSRNLKYVVNHVTTETWIMKNKMETPTRVRVPLKQTCESDLYKTKMKEK